MDVKVTLSNSEDSKSTFLPMDTAFSEFTAPIRWLIKLGIIALAILAIVLGVVTLFFTDYMCIIGGIILVVSGFLTICIEAPILCSFVKFIEPLTKLMASVRPWMKFIIYLTPGVGAIVLCQTVSAIFGGLALIMIAAAYFMTFMSRGKQKF